MTAAENVHDALCKRWAKWNALTSKRTLAEEQLDALDSEDLIGLLIERGVLYEVCACGCERERHDLKRRFCHSCWSYCPYTQTYRKSGHVAGS